MRWVGFAELVVSTIDRSSMPLMKRVGLELDFIVMTIRESMVVTIVFCCMVSSSFLRWYSRNYCMMKWKFPELDIMDFCNV